jgi:hypothetical protein
MLICRPIVSAQEKTMPLKTMIMAAAAATFMLGSAAATAAPNFEDGLWEITVNMNMPGMPAMQPRTIRQCMTQKDIKDPRKALSNSSHENQCKTLDYKQDGDTVTWKVECGGAHPMTGTGSATYKGDSYTGVNHLKMNEGGQAMEMTMNYSGKRVGACNK